MPTQGCLARVQIFLFIWKTFKYTQSTLIFCCPAFSSSAPKTRQRCTWRWSWAPWIWPPGGRRSWATSRRTCPSTTTCSPCSTGMVSVWLVGWFGCRNVAYLQNTKRNFYIYKMRKRNEILPRKSRKLVVYETRNNLRNHQLETIFLNTITKTKSTFFWKYWKNGQNSEEKTLISSMFFLLRDFMHDLWVVLYLFSCVNNFGWIFNLLFKARLGPAADAHVRLSLDRWFNGGFNFIQFFRCLNELHTGVGTALSPIGSWVDIGHGLNRKL